MPQAVPIYPTGRDTMQAYEGYLEKDWQFVPLGETPNISERRRVVVVLLDEREESNHHRETKFGVLSRYFGIAKGSTIDKSDKEVLAEALMEKYESIS